MGAATSRSDLQEDQGKDGERSTDSKIEDQRPTHSLLENLPRLYTSIRVRLQAESCRNAFDA
jgi:hypothetical protein